MTAAAHPAPPADDIEILEGLLDLDLDPPATADRDAAMATGSPRRRARTADEWQSRLDVQRRAGCLQQLADAVAESQRTLEVPAPVERVERRGPGVPPKLNPAALELARQVYYLQHGTLADAARAIIAADLADTQDVTVVRERLQTWWARERWPKRSTRVAFAIRDTTHDGGLYRSPRLCVGETSGNGPAPKGKKCEQSALADSDWCFHHDPRPEYVAKRAVQTARLRAGRQAGMVPLAPFQAWCEAQRHRMLTQAQASRPVHPNATGWGLLADAMGVDQSALGRLMKGVHSARPGRVTKIKAVTVARYVAPLGLTFRDIYGFDPPSVGDPAVVCPGCGGAKGHESTVCLDCFDATQGAPCSYVNRRGVRCRVLTRHESGVCAKCRQITERIPKPRTGRASYLTPRLLTLALGEYRDLPVTAWVASRMWTHNAGEVRGVFTSRKSLAGALAKYLRKHGWNTAAAAEKAYAELVAEHGPAAWPSSPLEETTR